MYTLEVQAIYRFAKAVRTHWYGIGNDVEPHQGFANPGSDLALLSEFTRLYSICTKPSVSRILDLADV